MTRATVQSQRARLDDWIDWSRNIEPCARPSPTQATQWAIRRQHGPDEREGCGERIGRGSKLVSVRADALSINGWIGIGAAAPLTLE